MSVDDHRTQMMRSIIAAHGIHRDERMISPDEVREDLANRDGDEAAAASDSEAADQVVEEPQERAGVIAAFDPETGELTVDTSLGTALTAMVTDETEIECENGHGPTPSEHGEEGVDDDHAASTGSNRNGYSVADLVPGRSVVEAGLGLSSSGLEFEDITLL